MYFLDSVGPEEDSIIHAMWHPLKWMPETPQCPEKRQQNINAPTTPKPIY